MERVRNMRDEEGDADRMGMPRVLGKVIVLPRNRLAIVIMA